MKLATRTTLAAAMLAATGMIAGNAQADTATGDETLYEGFNYADSSFWEPGDNTKAVDGVESGSGWSQNDWAQGTKNGIDSQVAWGQTYGVGTLALDTTAGGAGSGANLWGNRSRQFGTALDGMMDDGDTLWFSALVATDSAFGTEKLGLVISDGDWSGSNQEAMDAGVSAIGFISSNTGPAKAYTSVAGTGTASAAGVTVNTDLGNANFIIGKIEFGATDTISLYAPGSSVDSLGAVVATHSAAVDQSNFDSVAVLVKEGAYIDEIRVGSYAGALGRYAGDTDNNKLVEFADFNNLANNYTTGTLWSQGDSDGDGDVDFGDFNLLANNYGAVPAIASAAVEEAVAPGEAKLLIGLDGSLTIEGGNVDLNGYSITSAGGLLIPDGDASAAPFLFYLSNTSTEVAGANVGSTTNIDGTLLLDAALSGDVNLNDLVFQYGTSGGTFSGAVEIVPEPSSLALLGLGGLLVARRRRK